VSLTELKAQLALIEIALADPLAYELEMLDEAVAFVQPCVKAVTLIVLQFINEKFDAKPAVDPLVVIGLLKRVLNSDKFPAERVFGEVDAPVF
jgi:hypothetical protein